MDPVTTTISAFSGVIVSTVKTAEKIFEICAVDDQARSLLATVDQVMSQLRDARALRHKKSSLFTTFEKQTFDSCFSHADRAITQVAALAERPRADMKVSGGRVKFNTRVLYMLRDSPNVQVTLTQLAIASQSLNSTFMTLMNRECRSEVPVMTGGNSPVEGFRPPPTYDEAMFLSAGRQRIIQRRASRATMADQSRPRTPVELPEGGGAREGVNEGLAVGEGTHSNPDIYPPSPGPRSTHLSFRTDNAGQSFPPAQSSRTAEADMFLSSARRGSRRRRATTLAGLHASASSSFESLQSLRLTRSLPEDVPELAERDDNDGLSVLSLTVTDYDEEPQYIPYRPRTTLDNFDSAAPRQGSG